MRPEGLRKLVDSAGWRRDEAGVVLGDSAAAVSALRPHARVLLVTRDPQEVAALLSVAA